MYLTGKKKVRAMKFFRKKRKILEPYPPIKNVPSLIKLSSNFPRFSY